MKKKFFIIGLLLFMIPINAEALTKNESVFSSLNTDGTMYKTTVTNHIKISSKEEIEDNSELRDIINVNGNESFSQNANNLKWKSNGKDIYYQGTTNKDLPLSIHIKYFLNGNEINAAKLKNKKGHIKIEISLKNNEKHLVNIDGNVEELYTPFMVMAGTIIDNKNNENITVTNGKVVETGSKSIVTAMASPGLFESLNINESGNINKIVVEYDTNKFDFKNLYIVATPKIIEKQDLKLFDNVDSLYNSISSLQENMNKINSGADKLSKATKDLNDGVKKINQNMPSEKSYKENETNLNYLKNTNNSTIDSLTSANDNLSSQKEIISSKIKEANSKKGYVESQITEVDKNIERARYAYNSYSNQATELESSIEMLKAKISNTEDENTLEVLNKQLGELEGQQTLLQSTIPLLKNQVVALEGTKSALEGTKEAIDSTLTLLEQTSNSLSASINANSKLSSLINGNNKVVNSSIETITRMRLLSDGLSKLEKGTNELNNGTKNLSNGITLFNKEGIGSLSNYSGVIKRYSSRAEALIDLSNNYNGFTSNNSNETLFINKVKSIN